MTGGPYPAQGMTLDVEVQEGMHWKIFDQVVTNRKGQFRYSYRSTRAETAVYTFRVACWHRLTGYPSRRRERRDRGGCQPISRVVLAGTARATGRRAAEELHAAGKDPPFRLPGCGAARSPAD